MKCELDWFAEHPTQSSILRTEEVLYNTIASLDGASSIELVCLGNCETYLDLLSVYLRLVVQLRTNECCRCCKQYSTFNI